MAMLGSVWVSAVAATVLALRTYALARAVAWVGIHGKAFRDAVLAETTKGDLTPAIRVRIFSQCSGHYFPFGVKQSRLRKVRVDPTANQLVRLLAALTIAFWNYFVFAAVFVALLAVAAWGVSSEHWQLNFALRVGASFVLVLNALLLTIEAVLAFVNMGGWGSAYHGFKTAGKLNEFFPLFGAAIVLVSGASVLYYTIAMNDISAFARIKPTSPFGTFWSSTFQALRTILTSGDPEPVTSLAQAAVAAVLVVGVAFTLVAVGFTISAVSSASNAVPISVGVDSADHPPSAEARQRTPMLLKIVSLVALAGVLKRLRTLARRGGGDGLTT